jgi:8-hydroxy-5-deazaflavin:NADPH oxidoreductase
VNIAIVGTGSVGGTLARRLAAAGHHVTIANSRGPQTLTDLAAETGAVPLPVTDVARGAEIVIVAIPFGAIPSLPGGVLDGLAPGSIVIDAGNYVPSRRDANIPELDSGAVESRWTEAHLGRAVIKAFNSITPAHLATLGQPAGAAGRVGLPVAGDDPAAKAAVIELMDQIGFDGVDAGDLNESWRQQPGTPAYLTDLSAASIPAALAAASPEQISAWRGQWAAASR